MKLTRPVLCIAVSLLCAAPLLAQGIPLTLNTRDMAPAAESPAARIDAVAWIAGNWEGRALGGSVEEIWTSPRRGSMMGSFRLTGDGGPQFYEILTISEEGGSLLLRLKHFHADLRGWEEKDEVLRFPLIKVAGDEVHFAGFTFRRAGPDRLEVFVAQRAEGGEASELTFAYTRSTSAR